VFEVLVALGRALRDTGQPVDVEAGIAAAAAAFL
jgi:hypothetical protein